MRNQEHLFDITKEDMLDLPDAMRVQMGRITVQEFLGEQEVYRLFGIPKSKGKKCSFLRICDKRSKLNFELECAKQKVINIERRINELNL